MQQNTRQFVEGRPANNVLLTGARGTGKSSLIKACLNEFADQGLRLIEVDKADLVDLPDIVEVVSQRPEKFIVFSDDLSFDEGEPGYKALKSILDGSVAASTPNVLIYATSNRRHLLKERFSDPRRSKITFDVGDMNIEDLIDDEELVVTLSAKGYIKTVSSDAFRSQGRGGRGVAGASPSASTASIPACSGLRWITTTAARPRSCSARDSERPGSRDGSDPYNP